MIESKKADNKIIYIIFPIILLVIIFIILSLGTDKEEITIIKESCGDGICKENCLTCQSDCACESNQQCNENGRCVDLLQPLASTDTCGNRKCEFGENCANCPKDCKCEAGEYCDRGNGACRLPECGNGVCEIFETSVSCCNDCGCSFMDMGCNKETHTCGYPESKMNDHEALNIAKKYLKDIDKTFISIIDINPYSDMGVPGKILKLEIVEQTNCVVIVMDDGRVEELLTT